MEELYDGIRNISEEFIAEKLDEVWATGKYCRCSKCRRDVYTYVLNKIAPHYAESPEGELYMKLDFRNNGHSFEMIKIINAAMEVVGKNPKHDELEPTDGASVPKSVENP